MKRLRPCLTLAALIAAALAPACQKPIDTATRSPPAVVALVGVTVLQLDGSADLSNHSVIVSNGRIERIGPVANTAIQPGARIVPAAGQFLMPGLVDLHIHLRDPTELVTYLRWGVTTVLHMSGASSGAPHLQQYRSEIRAGQRVGPRLFLTGPLLDGPRPTYPSVSVSLATTSEAIGEVRRQRSEGYDFLKVYNGLAPDVFAALAEEARRVGMPLIGHVPRAAGLETALRMGQALIAHSDEYFFTFFKGPRSTSIPLEEMLAFTPDYSRLDDAAQLTADAGAAVTPNLVFMESTRRMIEDEQTVFRDGEFRKLSVHVQEMWRTQRPGRRSDLPQFRAREATRSVFASRLVQALKAARVPLMVGTDASAPGVFPGRAVHDEIRLLQASGLTNKEALSAATQVPSAFLQRTLGLDSPPAGVIKVGARADMILLERNPALDINALSSLQYVVTNGVVYRREEFEALGVR
jgi:imidazolonepropionase-like amidohydrolase